MDYLTQMGLENSAFGNDGLQSLTDSLAYSQQSAIPNTSGSTMKDWMGVGDWATNTYCKLTGSCANQAAQSGQVVQQSPLAAIPSWAWIAGAALLAVLILKD